MKTENKTYGPDDVLKVPDAARIAGCGERAIRSALDEGAIRGRNLGGSSGWRFTHGALMDWINGDNNAETS